MRDKESLRYEAVEVLTRCHIKIGQNFHTLNSSQVEQLLEFADRDKYRKPKNANGSRGRYYHDRLQRHARLPRD